MFFEAFIWGFFGSIIVILGGLLFFFILAVLIKFFAPDRWAEMEEKRKKIK